MMTVMLMITMPIIPSSEAQSSVDHNDLPSMASCNKWINHDDHGYLSLFGCSIYPFDERESGWEEMRDNAKPT